MASKISKFHPWFPEGWLSFTSVRALSRISDIEDMRVVSKGDIEDRYKNLVASMIPIAGLDFGKSFDFQDTSKSAIQSMVFKVTPRTYYVLSRARPKPLSWVYVRIEVLVQEFPFELPPVPAISKFHTGPCYDPFIRISAQDLASFVDPEHPSKFVMVRKIWKVLHHFGRSIDRPGPRKLTMGTIVFPNIPTWFPDQRYPRSFPKMIEGVMSRSIWWTWLDEWSRNSFILLIKSVESVISKFFCEPQSRLYFKDLGQINDLQNKATIIAESILPTISSRTWEDHLPIRSDHQVVRIHDLKSPTT